MINGPTVQNIMELCYLIRTDIRNHFPLSNKQTSVNGNDKGEIEITLPVMFTINDFIEDLVANILENEFSLDFSECQVKIDHNKMKLVLPETYNDYLLGKSDW